MDAPPSRKLGVLAGDGAGEIEGGGRESSRNHDSFLNRVFQRKKPADLWDSGLFFYDLAVFPHDDGQAEAAVLDA